MDPTFGECIKKGFAGYCDYSNRFVEKNIGILLFSYFYIKL